MQRWHDAIAARPAIVRGVAVLAANRRTGAMTDAERETCLDLNNSPCADARSDGPRETGAASIASLKLAHRKGFNRKPE